ncbi:hypothetical protein [Lacrimispora amygdalina]|uniref:hypothetical protein n=1 Tax=Lacrimispora amygdalina TaxID=253257 RepID=UPI000BE46D5E|nr:hypothetical protein [Lacrimispora amygdalina]
MKKNNKLKLGLFLFFSIFLFGCNNDNDKINTTMVVDTQPATMHVDETNVPHENISIITTGVLTKVSDEIDNYGNKRAYFTGDDGVDFISVISETTILPADLIIGSTYNVFHSDITTMSIPGQYPEVYKIIAVTQNIDEQETPIDSFNEN